MKTDGTITGVETLEIPTRFRDVFLKVEAILKKEYGASPPVDDLIRMWIGCATPEELLQEFEEAVLGLSPSTIRPDAEGLYDEKSL